MGKPKLYYHEASPFSRTVLLTLKAINYDLELVVTNGSLGETKTPEFLKMNPQHTIPTLDDNGKYITDSHAISVYLVNKYGKSEDQSLAPKADVYERAVLESRLHFCDSTFVGRLFKLLGPIYRQGADKLDEEALKTVAESVEFLEAFLQNGDYVCGNNLTVADFAIVTMASLYFALIPIDETKLPKLAGWLKRMAELPYYEEIIQKHVKTFLDTMAEKLKK